jgi:hypothetical protein
MFVQVALKFVVQNVGDVVDVILLYFPVTLSWEKSVRVP